MLKYISRSFSISRHNKILRFSLRVSFLSGNVRSSESWESSVSVGTSSLVSSVFWMVWGDFVEGASFDESVSVSEPVVHWVEVWIDWCRWVLDLLSNGGSFDEGVTVSEPVVHWVEVWINWSGWVLDLLSNGASFDEGVTVSESIVHWVEVWIDWSRWVLDLLSNGGSLDKGVTVSEPVVHWVEVWINWSRWVLNLTDLHMSTSG